MALLSGGESGGSGGSGGSSSNLSRFVTQRHTVRPKAAEVRTGISLIEPRLLLGEQAAMMAIYGKCKQEISTIHLTGHSSKWSTNLFDFRLYKKWFKDRGPFGSVCSFRPPKFKVHCSRCSPKICCQKAHEHLHLFHILLLVTLSYLRLLSTTVAGTVDSLDLLIALYAIQTELSKTIQNSIIETCKTSFSPKGCDF